MFSVLSATATGRSTSLFNEDISENHDALSAAVKGKRILAVGAAGSIGSNTVATLVKFAPHTLHVIDQNENAQAELVRQMRNSAEPMQVEDFQTLPLDYGSPATRLFMEQNKPYDLILNFAAIKHVRSEKDPFSILQMLDTNIIKQARFRDWIAATSPNADYFSVSTDKAANPVSFMGATKRIMEHVLFDGAREAGLTGRVTTARFANVAYSNGSLLQSFENRLARNEPLAAPKGIERYFVSLEESGQICTLASLLAPHAHVAIPRLDPKEHLVPLQSVAENFLSAHKLEPVHMSDEREACTRVAELRAKGQYPLLLTSANTAGEKPYEEFVGKGEKAVEINLKHMQAVPYIGIRSGNSVPHIVGQLSEYVAGEKSEAMGKDEIKNLIAQLEPDFLQSHIESKLNLDQRV